MIGIYKITNKLNGKSYIGQSIHIEKRWQEHKRNIGSNKNPMYLDFEKYGIDNFSFEILEQCQINELDEKEIYYISLYNTFLNGYNLTTGGNSKKSYILMNFPKDLADEIAFNSMHLYFLLQHFSHKREEDLFFLQSEINVNKIKETLHMHPKTIKKYWKLLEDNKLIKYEGPAIYANDEDEWGKEFMKRKKDGATYYTIPKKSPYRIMPRETLDKIQYEFLVSERELKIYLLLAEMQERFCYMNSQDREFTIADIRGLLKLSKDRTNNRTIIDGLRWLKELNLIDYDLRIETTNLGTKLSIFELKNVNYYTDGGTAAQYLNTEGEKLSEEIKSDMLNKNVVIIFE